MNTPLNTGLVNFQATEPQSIEPRLYRDARVVLEEYTYGSGRPAQFGRPGPDNVWVRIATNARSLGASPLAFVAIQYRMTLRRLGPEYLASEVAIRNFRQWQQNAAHRVVGRIRADQAVFDIAVFQNRAYFPSMGEIEVHRSTVSMESNQLSPLYRLYLALALDLDGVVDAYLSQAVRQYLMDRELYEALLFGGEPPKRLVAAAREYF